MSDAEPLKKAVTNYATAITEKKQRIKEAVQKRQNTQSEETVIRALRK